MGRAFSYNCKYITYPLFLSTSKTTLCYTVFVLKFRLTMKSQALNRKKLEKILERNN